MILRSENETLAFGAKLGAMLRQGDCIALRGDLGVGKTVIARGVLQALGHEAEVPSPTFPIVQVYEDSGMRVPVWHIDLHRIENERELEELGLHDMRREVAMLIEWPERLGGRLWSDTLRLTIVVEPQRGEQPPRRRLTAEVPPAWEARWPRT